MTTTFRWLLDAAYAYVTEILDEGRSVYRIFHAELARHICGDRDPAEVNRILTELLVQHVPIVHGRRDWQAAHPYVRRHLAEHAAAADRLDQLLEDPHYLLTVDPALLVPTSRLQLPARRGPPPPCTGKAPTTWPTLTRWDGPASSN